MSCRVSILMFLLLLPLPALADEARALWNAGVQALFDQNCVKCHGPLEQKAGLELDTIEAALKGDEAGAVIVPGAPEKSPLIAALAPGADPHMPPKKQLAPEEIEKLRTWIAALGKRATTETHIEQKLAFSNPSEAIEHFLAESWRQRALTPAPACDDRTFLRRVYLDLAGRIPNREEADAFLNECHSDKRTALVDRLLASDEYARTFREIWDALLMGRNVGRREQRRRESGWFDFLEHAFKTNRPWNEVVRAMVVARPEKPEEKGALWFVFERRNEHQRIAEALAPVVYGTRLDCAQCHDHPLAREIKQGHYWSLVAAFNRSKNMEKGMRAVGESAVGGFVNFTNLKKESQPAVLTLLHGRNIEENRPASGAKEEDSPERYVDPAAPVKVPKFSRRAAVADALTRDNPLLARAFVNHTWAILMGRGIVHPVDEMNSKNPPSHPELLEWLAKDFEASGYDVKRLVRSIVQSRAYQLSASANASMPAEAFAAFAEKPLLAETVARSARIASGREPEDATLRQTFAERFPDVLPRESRATIQQAMLLANSDVLAGLFKPDPGTTAARLAALSCDEEGVRGAFEAALIREPDAEELAQGVAYLASRRDKPAEAIGELLWALVAGPEFLTNH